MKRSTYGLVLVLIALVAGCSGGDVGSAQGDIPTEPNSTGQVTEPAQFVNSAVFNLAGMLSVTPLEIHLTADVAPAGVNVYYVSDKTTDSGHVPGPVTLIQTLSLAADQTKIHTINWANSAFSGNYGAVLVSGVTGQDLFQVELLANFDSWSVGGSVFEGGSYRIPYFTGITQAIIAVTNQSDFAFDIQFANVNGTQSKTINLPVLSTYLFNSTGEGWTLSPPGSIQVTTTNSGTVALGGYLTKGTSSKYRFYPVKAAPYF